MLAIEPHALLAETADGSGTSVDINARRSCVVLRLRLSAISGTGASLTCYVESAPESTGPWLNHGSFSTLSAVGTKDLIVADTYQYVRVRWTLAGTTPSATFRINGSAHTLYATPSDVTDLALPADSINSVPAPVKALACLSATDEAATYLAGRFTLPITEWTTDLTMHVAMMAGYQIMKRRGFQPQGFDELIVKGRDDAIAYLKMIAANKLYPPGFVDSMGTDVGTNDAFVIENPVSQWDVYSGPIDYSTFGDPLTRG